MIKTITAGDTLKIALKYGEYPSADYAVWIALRGNARAVDIKEGLPGVTIDISRGYFDISVSPAATSAYPSGEYQYSIYVCKQSGAAITERFEVEKGFLEVRPDLAALSSAEDARSLVKKTLDAIEAVIAGRASIDQMSYEIAGRTLQRTPLADLLELRRKFKAEYEAEKRAEGIAQGYGNPSVVRVRL